MPARQSRSQQALAKKVAAQHPVRLTENGAPALASTTNPLLDFFFDVMQGASWDVIHRRLHDAWQFHPMNALKLVFNLRNVREGKSAKAEFYQCLLWLYVNHPATLKANLKHIPSHGYWKDLSAFLRLIAFNGQDPQPSRVTTPYVKTADYAVRPVLLSACHPPAVPSCYRPLSCTPAYPRKTRSLGLHTSGVPAEGESASQKRSTDRVSGVPLVAEVHEEGLVLKKPRLEGAAWGGKVEEFAKQRVYALVKKAVWKRYLRSLPAEEQKDAKAYFQACVKKYNKKFRQDAAEVRTERQQNIAATVADVREQHPLFDDLYQEVVYLFASALKADVADLAAHGRLPEGRLVGKWAPSPGRSNDKTLGMAAEIAKRLCLAGKDGEVSRVVPSGDLPITTQQMLDLYRHQYLNPLREYICSPERYMSAGRWNQLPYQRVPSVAMQRYTQLFIKHDSTRFSEYLLQVKHGKKKIASGALLPHQMVSAVQDAESDMEREVLELQWASYVKSLKETGTLENALAICDVSGSMHGTPLNAAVALSLLLAEICSPPFHQHVCTFSSKPQLQQVDQATLRERVEALERMDWEMNTDLQAVFDLLLSLAQSVSLPAQDMIKTLFIFSDMEFDECVTGGGMTDLQQARSKFEAAGYPMPTIVFWNLRGGDRSKPCMQDEGGVAMMSGFSGKMMKWFMSGTLVGQMQQLSVEQQAEAAHAASITPLDKLHQILASDLYSGLVVVD